MAPASKAPYYPSESNAPSSKLPEHMQGLIDLATLADMNRFLDESASPDDLALAGWIKGNFLYQPLDQTSRPIRTLEGFTKLDHAYRRVLSLTNKTQDKWPFLDQNFKVMPSTPVRINSRGEISPSVMFHQEGSALPASGVTATNSSPSPELRVPFGAKQLGRQRLQRQDPVRPSEHALTPLPSKLSTRSKMSPREDGQIAPMELSQSGELTPAESTNSRGFAKHAAPALFSNPNRPVTPQPELVYYSDDQIAHKTPRETASEQRYDTLRRDTEEFRAASVDSGLDFLRDAGNGKIRGITLNGRFQPKDLASPASERTTQRQTAKIKSGRNYQKSRSTAAEDVASAMTHPANLAPGQDDNVVSHVESPSTPIGGEYLDTTEVVGLPASGLSTAGYDEAHPELTAKSSKSRVRFSDSTSEKSTPAYTLAVESDPVVSNLDRLPPNALKLASKRKSPPTFQSSPHKRGRPSKSEPAPVAPDADAQLAAHNDTNTNGCPKKIGVTTRRAHRSLRRSAAADSSTNDKPPKESEAPKFNDEDATMIDAGAKNMATVQEKLAPAPVLKASKMRTKPRPRATSPRATRSRASLLGQTLSKDSTSGSADDHLLDFALSQMDKADSASSRRGLLQPMAALVQGKNLRSENLAKQTAPFLENVANNDGATPKANTPVSANQAAQQAMTENSEVSKVEYFARVHTSTGPIDVPMLADQIKPEEKELLKKYAVFVSKNGAAAIDLDIFREIYVSAKQ